MEGGSGQPLAENTEAANLTRERVYVLAGVFKVMLIHKAKEQM